MGFRTVLLYLLGSRAAILTLASNRWTPLIGAFFVLSAAFAREYDGEDLWHSPWYLLVPFAASLVASFLLYWLVYVAAALHKRAFPFWANYSAFLGLFWMTAPLAWLYAIPYERFLDPLQATQANVYTLALVALWRVVLMMRVVQVLATFRPFAAVTLVLAFADAVALIALAASPVRVIEIMGGIRVDEADRWLQSAGQGLFCWGFSAGPVLVIIVSIALGASQPLLNRPAWSTSPPTWPLRIVAFLALAIWIPILPFTQAEQQNRRQADQAIQERRYGDAIDLISAKLPQDFPPHWQPSGARSIGYVSPSSSLELWEAIADRPITPPWVRQLFVPHLTILLSAWPSQEYLDQVERMLKRLPDADALLQSAFDTSGGSHLRHYDYFKEKLKAK